jgi:hypothetical protein
MSASATPSVMTVYFGHISEGELEDHGPGDVRAWVGIGEDRVAIGVYPDRKTAMRAVSEASKAAGAAG